MKPFHENFFKKERKLRNRSNRKPSALEAPEFDIPLFPREIWRKMKNKRIPK